MIKERFDSNQFNLKH